MNEFERLKIFLVSKSPRRRKLLKILGLKFKASSVNVDESFKKNESPLNAALRIAKLKLNAAKLKHKNGLLITADTIVVLNNKVIGKPKDKNDAFKILKLLSGNTHIVYTAFGVYNGYNSKIIINYEKTFVTFKNITDDEIIKYIKTGSPMDKAGAYGIQDDYGATFIKKINGCYYNVVGLPLSKLMTELKKVL